MIRQVTFGFLISMMSSCTSLLCFADGDQQTELNQTAKLCVLTICCFCRRNVESSLSKIGGEKLLHLFGFSTISRLNSECLLNETWHRQSGKGAVPKFHELWSTKGLKWERNFYPPSLFCYVPVNRTPSNRHLRGAPETALDLSAAQIRSPTRC